MVLTSTSGNREGVRNNHQGESYRPICWGPFLTFERLRHEALSWGVEIQARPVSRILTRPGQGALLPERPGVLGVRCRAELHPKLGPSSHELWVNHAHYTHFLFLQRDEASGTKVEKMEKTPSTVPAARHLNFVPKTF